MRILIVDDQQVVLMLLEKGLKNLGYEVCVTKDAQEGFDLFDTFNPHLVIVDINMPKISGIDFIKNIRTEKHSTTPIIVLSGNTNSDVISKAFEFGVNDYLSKTLSLNDIYTRIKRLNIYFQIH